MADDDELSLEEEALYRSGKVLSTPTLFSSGLPSPVGCLCAARTLEAALESLSEYYDRTRRVGRSRLAVLTSDGKDALNYMDENCGLGENVSVDHLKGLVDKAWEMRGKEQDADQFKVIRELQKAWREATC